MSYLLFQAANSSGQMSGDLRNLLSEWWNQRHDVPVTTQDVLRLARDNKLLLHAWSDRREHGAMVSIGSLLSNLRDQVIGEFRVRSDRRAADGHARMWHLELVSSVSDSEDSEFKNSDGAESES